MKKKFSAFVVFTILLVLLLPLDTLALNERLIDDACLLDEESAGEISRMLDDVSEKYGMDVVILTTDSFEYADNAEDDATERYEAQGFNVDGVMLYVNMGSRDWYILTSGYGIEAFSDIGIEVISEQLLPDLSEGYYSDAFNTFISYADTFIEAARNGTLYDEDNLPKTPFSIGTSLVISLIIGFVVALIVTGIWKGQLKSVSMKAEASDYVKPGSLAINGSRELFLYRNISRTPRQTSSSSGGGSATHRSSSGRTYGGRGGKF